MNEQSPITVFPTIGATAVNVDEHFVFIGQDDYTGNGDRLEVDIPRIMFPLVMEAIFTKLRPDELDRIASLAAAMASQSRSAEA